jgi:hypothetical protein
MAWISVLEHAICNMMKNPTGISRLADIQKIFEKANAIRLTPNPAQQIEISLPNPFTPVRTARVKAPNSAPIPVKPIKMPSPFAPECNTWSAKIGISTV